MSGKRSKNIIITRLRSCYLKIIIKELQKGNNVDIRVEGYSMIPVIKPGQRVSVSPRSLEMIRKNDIIAYKLDVNPWITVHRVISIRKNGKKFCFKTKGDHMEVVDPYEVSETSYLGIVNTSVIQEDSTQWLESCPF